METLRLGSAGENVKKWQFFLIGQSLYSGVADGVFGPGTETASKTFQSRYTINPDGVVGNTTMAKAMLLGFQVITDTSNTEDSPNWPPPPSFGPIIGNETRQVVFGKFSYVSAGVPGNPEAIKITDNWESQNIVNVTIPQLVGVVGAPKSGTIRFHKLGAKQLVAMFAEWESAGLKTLIKTWGGSFVPRFIRGSTTSLSNHSFGSAFDMNVAWNPLGTRGALVGQEGSVRKLVPIANKWGFYWGGHFTGRPDGMHFEIAKVLK